mmetsp:Transcript_903/g.3066  ORF Transcript_903/g.3066 Transcript_903/m.3066 type:complete len:318 (-) Transcript_903:384-1337(-)
MAGVERKEGLGVIFWFPPQEIEGQLRRNKKDFRAVVEVDGVASSEAVDRPAEAADFEEDVEEAAFLGVADDQWPVEDRHVRRRVGRSEEGRGLRRRRRRVALESAVVPMPFSRQQPAAGVAKFRPSALVARLGAPRRELPLPRRPGHGKRAVCDFRQLAQRPLLKAALPQRHGERRSHVEPRPVVGSVVSVFAVLSSRRRKNRQTRPERGRAQEVVASFDGLVREGVEAAAHEFPVIRDALRVVVGGGGPPNELRHLFVVSVLRHSFPKVAEGFLVGGDGAPGVLAVVGELPREDRPGDGQLQIPLGPVRGAGLALV